MNECHCLIRHARTEAERIEAGKNVQRARRLGDHTGLVIALASLGPCKSDPVEAPGAHRERVNKYAPEKRRAHRARA